MSKEPNDILGSLDIERRKVFRAASDVAIAGIAASAMMNAPALAEGGAPNAGASGNRNNAALGARLQGVQHFGLTVLNMDRAFEFHTEVLGGSEVMRDGDFHGEKIRYTLMADQEILDA